MKSRGVSYFWGADSLFGHGSKPAMPPNQLRVPPLRFLLCRRRCALNERLEAKREARAVQPRPATT